MTLNRHSLARGVAFGEAVRRFLFCLLWFCVASGFWFCDTVAGYGCWFWFSLLLLRSDLSPSSRSGPVCPLLCFVTGSWIRIWIWLALVLI